MTSTEKEQADASPLLSVFLAAAMFVFVIDTSFMNVSISAVVRGPRHDGERRPGGGRDRGAGVRRLHPDQQQARRPLRPQAGLRRRACCSTRSGALAMVFAQGLAAIIVFWAVIGGLGASLYLPAMQSLIHGNFEGKARAKVFALVGASGAIAAAIGPLIGGFVTTVLSWRVGFVLEGADHRGRPGREQADPRRAVHGRSVGRRGRRVPLRGRHGRPRRRRARLAGGRRVGRGSARDRRRGDGGPGVLAPSAASARARPTLLDPALFALEAVQLRGLPDLPPAGRARRDADRAADLLAARLGLQRARGGRDPRAAVADDVRRRAARREDERAGGGRAASSGPASCCSRRRS